MQQKVKVEVLSIQQSIIGCHYEVSEGESIFCDASYIMN